MVGNNQKNQILVYVLIGEKHITDKPPRQMLRLIATFI